MTNHELTIARVLAFLADQPPSKTRVEPEEVAACLTPRPSRRALEDCLSKVTPEDGWYFRFSNSEDGEDDEFCFRASKALFRRASTGKRGRPPGSVEEGPDFTYRFSSIIREWLKGETRRGRRIDSGTFTAAVLGSKPSLEDQERLARWIEAEKQTGRLVVEPYESGFGVASTSKTQKTVKMLAPHRYRDGTPGTRPKPEPTARRFTKRKHQPGDELVPAEPPVDNRPVTRFKTRMPLGVQHQLNVIESQFLGTPEGNERTREFLRKLGDHYAKKRPKILGDRDVIKLLVGVAEGSKTPIRLPVLKAGQRMLEILVERGLLRYAFLRRHEFGWEPAPPVSGKRFLPV